MYIKPAYANDHFYHIYNRGVAKQNIFKSDADFMRLLTAFSFYLEKQNQNRLSKVAKEDLSKILNQDPKNPLVEIVIFCLMPNHFHLILRQIIDNGIVIFLRRSLDSYTRYFNVKNNRVGTIFQGRSRAVLIESDEQLLHLSRYIHLNPFVAGICKEASKYGWSSYQFCLKAIKSRLCNPDSFLNTFERSEDYREFVEDYASYACELARIKDFLHDGNAV